MARKAGADTAPSDSITHPLQPERCLQIIVNTQAKLSLKVQVSEVAHRTTRNLRFPHNFEKCCKQLLNNSYLTISIFSFLFSSHIILLFSFIPTIYIHLQHLFNLSLSLPVTPFYSITPFHSTSYVYLTHHPLSLIAHLYIHAILRHQPLQHFSKLCANHKFCLVLCATLLT